MTGYPPESVADALDIDLLVVADPGDVFDHDGEEDYALVDGAVVFEVVQHGDRGPALGATHENGGAWDDNWGPSLQAFDELILGDCSLIQSFANEASSGCPGGHQDESDGSDGEWQPAACEELGQVRAEEPDFDAGKEAAQHKRL